MKPIVTTLLRRFLMLLSAIVVWAKTLAPGTADPVNAEDRSKDERGWTTKAQPRTLISAGNLVEGFSIGSSIADAANYLAFIQLATIREWLRVYEVLALALLWEINGIVTMNGEALRFHESASNGGMERCTDGLAQTVC